MKYKIDTKEHFEIITPLYAQFDSILSDQLNELRYNSGTCGS